MKYGWVAFTGLAGFVAGTIIAMVASDKIDQQRIDGRFMFRDGRPYLITPISADDILPSQAEQRGGRVPQPAAPSQ